jgi:hypothetical protein
MPEPDFGVKSVVSLSETLVFCFRLPPNSQPEVPPLERNLLASSSRPTLSMQAHVGTVIVSKHEQSYCFIFGICSSTGCFTFRVHLCSIRFCVKYRLTNRSAAIHILELVFWET